MRSPAASSRPVAAALLRPALAFVALAGAACSSSDPALTAPFEDHFARPEIGADYRATADAYRTEGGKLVFARAHNHPLWLRRRLPPDVRVELDCMTQSPDGDIKVELFGDGRTFQPDDDVAKDLIYTASGYVFIFGGWRNSRSVLVKRDEHEWQHRAGVPVRTAPRVEPGRSYHFKIERRGGHIDWFIDGQPFLSLDDPQPLAGAGHDHFGFNGWETEVAISNLKIEPL
jgi:hypothetical protein